MGKQRGCGTRSIRLLHKPTHSKYLALPICLMRDDPNLLSVAPLRTFITRRFLNSVEREICVSGADYDGTRKIWCCNYKQIARLFPVSESLKKRRVHTLGLPLMRHRAASNPSHSSCPGNTGSTAAPQGTSLPSPKSLIPVAHPSQPYATEIPPNTLETGGEGRTARAWCAKGRVRVTG